MKRLLILLILLWVWWAGPVSADIYRWTDANGVTHFSNEPPPAVQAEYRSLVDSKVRLAESEGRWLEPPRISLSRFENRQGADGASHAIVAAVTDDTGIAQVRTSVDGDRLLFLDMSGRPLTEQSVSLPWATSSETKRYEIIATDTDGLVARYVTDL